MAAPQLSKLSRWIQRRPTAAHWLVVAAIAAVAALGVAGAHRSANEAAAAWGEPVTVLVAQTSLAAGLMPNASQVAAVAAPSHLVPAGALTDHAQMSHLARLVPRGSVLTQADLTPPIAVPAGLVGVGIAPPATAPVVPAGTPIRLLLFAEIDPYDPTGAPVSEVAATLLSAEEERWVVGVDGAAVQAVARADVAGRVVPVLEPNLVRGAPS